MTISELVTYLQSLEAQGKGDYKVIIHDQATQELSEEMMEVADPFNPDLPEWLQLYDIYGKKTLNI